MSVFVFKLFRVLGILVHGPHAHTHAGETAIVEEVLHGHLSGEVGEHHHRVVGTLLGSGVAQWRHLVGEVHEVLHAFHAIAGRGGRGTLGDSVDAHVLLAAIDVAKTAGDAFQKAFGIGHVVVAEEGALSSHIGQSDNRGIFVEGIELFGHLQHLVKRDGTDVERLRKVVVVQIVVRTLLTYVEAHADGMEDEVNLSAEQTLALGEYLFQVFHTGGIGRDDRCVELFGEGVERAHAQGNGGVGERDAGTFFHSLDGYFPSDGLFVKRAEDDATLTFQEVVSHKNYLVFVVVTSVSKETSAQKYVFCASLAIFWPPKCDIHS